MAGLKGITVNTAPEAEPHIFAEDDAAIFQSIFGEDGVSSVGQACKATVLSNNKVRVADGVIFVGGHFARIPYGEYVDCEIANGQSGKRRNDIIVAKFVTTGSGGIDTMTCEVKQGTAGTTATDPTIIQDDIYKSGKIREFPLYRVRLDGLNITAVEQLFTVVPTNEELILQLKSMQTRHAELTALTEKYHSFDFLPAYKNGTLSNALLVSLTDPYSDNNKTRYVNVSSAKNLPADCQWGVREVSYVGQNFVIVRITGYSTANVMAYWENCYVNGTWLGWQTFSPVKVPIKNNVTGMLQRTAVYTGTGGTSVALLTYENVRTWFGVTNVSNENVCVFAMNGDGGASGIHIDGTTWAPSGGVCYATFNKALATGSRVRINMLITYNGS